jgi:F-type H+-transporting ATPase subunit delta
LLDAARDKGRIEQVREELEDFTETVREVPELGEVLRNPQLDPRAKASALSALTEGYDELVRNFLRLLAEKGRAGQLDEIQREFDRLVAREQGQLNVELTTAIELSDAEARAILDQIERATGRRIEAVRKVDASLIGGLILQAGSLRLDASVRGRLERLRQGLTQGVTA